MMCAAIGSMATAGMLPACVGNEKNKEPKNILFVIFDDLRPEIGCYGQSHMVTPNMDALAKDGVVFQNAYVQQAVSAASRASFLTGCRPDVTGTDYPYSQYFVNEFLPEHGSIQRYMYEHGFYTRTFGKIHHGIYEDFSEPHFEPKMSNPHFALEKNIRIYKNRFETGIRTDAFECADVPDTVYRDGKIAEEVVKTIRNLKENNKEGKPFFLSVGFIKPHLPFCAPKKYFDLYNPKEIPLSPNPQHTKGAIKHSEAHSALVPWGGEKDDWDKVVSEKRQRELRRAYFACVSYVDAQLGKVIEALKEEGYYENTAIILIGDHGWHLGDNGMWGKSTNFERATNAPLIARISDIKAPKGRKSKAFVEFVDIFPTICELGGVDVPEYLEGTSFLPLMQKPGRNWKKAAFSQFPRGNDIEGYSIRVKRYRYVEWLDRRSGEIFWKELYDHKTDPYEKTNVIESHQKLAEQLSGQLHDGWKAALPDGVVNHSDNPLAPPAVGWGPEAHKKRK